MQDLHKISIADYNYTLPDEKIASYPLPQRDLSKLLIYQRGKKRAFEFKYADAPKLSPSMLTAIPDLKLDDLTVLIPGHHDFPIAQNIRVMGLAAYLAKGLS